MAYMAIIDDDMKGDFVNSSFLESVNSLSLREDALSPNDATWTDSCLNKNLNASNTDWNSIKEVLSKVLSSQSMPSDSVASENNMQLSIDGDPILRDYVATLTSCSGSDEGDIGSMEISDDEGNVTKANERGRVRGKACIENVFRPNYNPDNAKTEKNDTTVDHSLTTWESESSPDDLFNLWDLGISDEQDEFTLQLDKVFGDFPFPIQPNPDDSRERQDVMHVSVDDLVAGMGDFYLKQYTK